MRSILLKKKEKRKKDPQPRNARVFPLWLSANRITVGRNTLTFKCNNRSGWAKTQRMSPTYWSTWRNLASQSPIGSCVRLRLPPSPRPPFYFELQIIESEPVLVLFFPFPSRFLPMIHLQYSIRWRFGILFFSSFGSFGSFFLSFSLSFFLSFFIHFWSMRMVHQNWLTISVWPSRHPATNRIWRSSNGRSRKPTNLTWNHINKSLNQPDIATEERSSKSAASREFQMRGQQLSWWVVNQRERLVYYVPIGDDWGRIFSCLVEAPNRAEARAIVHWKRRGEGGFSRGFNRIVEGL